MSKKDSEYYLNNFKKIAINSFVNVFKINILFILLFGLVGYYLDNFFDTKPIILIISIMISMPLSIFVIYKKIKKDVWTSNKTNFINTK